MRSWFYHPGSAFFGFFYRVLWGARVEGVEHIPRDGSFILVANHCSNLDPPLLGWAVGHQVDRVVHFMAKIEMRSWPVLGWLAASAGTFFVRRGENDRAAQRFGLEALTDGRPIAIFPEGTRSRDGRLKAFKPGAAFLALRTGARILPVGVAGTQRIFPNGTRIPRATRIRVRIGEPFEVGHVPRGRLDREALERANRRMRDAIAALLPEEQRPV